MKTTISKVCVNTKRVTAQNNCSSATGAIITTKTEEGGRIQNNLCVDASI